MQPSADNFEAAKLEAILRILLGAETDDELEEAKKQAAALAEMEEDDIGRNEPARFARGNFLTALQFEAPRVPAGQKIDGMHGGQWVMAQALAEFYAELFNDLAEAGSPVEDDQVEGATDELEPHGWTLDRDEEDLWEAVPVEDLEEEAVTFTRRGRAYQYGAKRMPAGQKMTIAGKTYKGGMFIPSKVMEQATPEQKEAIEEGEKKAEAKRQGEKESRKNRGAVDTEKLKSRLKEKAGESELTVGERKRARSSLRLLLQHHGGLAVHRLEELAGQVEETMDGLEEDSPVRERLARKMAMLHSMVDLAKEEGITGTGDETYTKTSAPKSPTKGKTYDVALADLHVDPKRFQYKLNTNAEGVTQELKSVETFNPDFAGVISVWRDPKDGKTYVVNGHHRTELARRLGHPSLAVRYLEEPDEKKARAMGALINIAEGRGTAVDAAKFLRDYEIPESSLKKYGVSLKGKLAQDAAILTKLNDRIFQQVTMGTFDLSRALSIAAHCPNPDLQDLVVSQIEKYEDRTGQKLSDRTVAEMSRQVASAPTTKTVERDLFGEHEKEESLFVPMMEMQGHIRAELAKIANDFAALSSERRAEATKGAGNVLNTEQNKTEAQKAEQVKNVFDTLVKYKGNVKDAIEQAAREYVSATSQKQRQGIRDKALKAVRSAVEQELDNPSLGQQTTPPTQESDDGTLLGYSGDAGSPEDQPPAGTADAGSDLDSVPGGPEPVTGGERDAPGLLPEALPSVPDAEGSGPDGTESPVVSQPAPTPTANAGGGSVEPSGLDWTHDGVDYSHAHPFLRDHKDKPELYQHLQEAMREPDAKVQQRIDDLQALYRTRPVQATRATWAEIQALETILWERGKAGKQYAGETESAPVESPALVESPAAPQDWHAIGMTGEQFESAQKLLGVQNPRMGPKGTQAIEKALAKRPGGELIRQILLSGKDYGWHRGDGTPLVPGDKLKKIADGKYTAEELLDAAKWASSSQVRDGADRWIHGELATAKTKDGDTIDRSAFAYIQQAAKLENLAKNQFGETRQETLDSAKQAEKKAYDLAKGHSGATAPVETPPPITDPESSFDLDAWVNDRNNTPVTDPAEKQELKNSIAEGKLILQSGAFNGRKLSPQELLAVRRSVENSLARIGESRIAGKEVSPKIASGFTVEDVTPPGYGPEDSSTPPDSLWQPATHLKIAADSPPQLRRQDVFRVLDQAPPEKRQEMAQYLQSERPDLHDEVSEVMGELGDETTPESPATPPDPRVSSALERYDNRGNLPQVSGALFGGDDVRSRERFDKLPDGVRVVLTEGDRRGQVGSIRRQAMLDGSTQTLFQPEGSEERFPVAHTAVEPLDPSQSWRTETGAQPNKQSDLFSGGEYVSRMPQRAPGAEEGAEPAPKPDLATRNPETEPTTPVAEAKEKADQSGATPRQKAEEVTRASQGDYEFARASAIPNVGEDLKNSARHKVNQWRGLKDAEANGTAEAMLNRENLLKAEPHDLMATIEPTSALSHLASHLVMNAFPAGLDRKAVERYTKSGGAKTPEQLRAQYYEAYQEVKKEIERAAQEEIDPGQVAGRVNKLALRLINRFRGVEEGRSGYMARSGSSGSDRYNPVANLLVDLHKRTSTFRPGPTSVMGRVMDFVTRLKEKYGGQVNEDVLQRAAEHIKDVMEGDSYNKTFGTSKGEQKRFNPADAYVGHVTRKGGRVIDTSSVQNNLDYVQNAMKMRGLQWGNTVSDEERQHHLARASEALADLADVTGLPDFAMSYNGLLGLAIGARGKGSAMAHYEPDTKVINLTRKDGAGTLAHEWAHGLDHFLGGGGLSTFEGKRGGDYLSTRVVPTRIVVGPDGKQQKVDLGKDPLWSAMNTVRKTMGDSGFRKRVTGEVHAMKRDGRLWKNSDYWLSEQEMFARTFERYVQHKLQSADRENTYLSGVGNHELWPTDEEVAQMAPAFDALLKAVRNKHFPQQDAKPQQSSRSGQARRYLRLAESAEQFGDRASAAIYRKQARQLTGR